LFDVVLNICSQVFKMGVREPGEFQIVLDDIGLKGNKGSGVQQAFMNSFVQRLLLTNEMTEDTKSSMNGQVSKKVPLN